MERRKNPRIEPSASEPVRLNILKDYRSSETRVLNISERGVGFESREEFITGEEYVFALCLPQLDELVLCPAVIRFRRKKEEGLFHYGAELNISSEDRQALTQYVMKREAEIRKSLSEDS